MPGATLLTLTSLSTLDRSRYLRSQISSGYIAIRLERHQGHSARSHAAHLDEFVYSRQVTLPKESDQLRLHFHSVGTPPRSQCQEPRCSPSRALPISQHGRAPTQLFILTSSSYQSTWTSSYSTIHLDELFPSVNMDELYTTILSDELFPSVDMDELLLNYSS